MPSLTEFCPKLRDVGSCLDPACKYGHIMYSCQLCGFTGVSGDALKNHMKTKLHKQKSATTADFWKCTVCNQIVAADGWRSHSKSTSHRSKCKEKGIKPSKLKPTPSTTKAPAGYTFCPLCNAQILTSNWGSHLQSKKHKENQQWNNIKAALERAETDRNGISLQGDFDFGFLGQAQASAGTPAKTGTISLTDTQARVTLVNAILASSKGQRRSSFKLSQIGSQVVKPGSSITFSISLQQTHVGRCEDRVEFLFKQKSGTEFVIVRPLYAIVGEKSDYDRLKPTTPYKPPTRAARLPETNIIRGVPPPPLKAIKYKTKLPLAEIPSDLKAILSKGTVGQILHQIRETFLPQELDSRTHGTHFRHLVWAEECRQEQDMGMYDMFNIKLISTKAAFRLKVPGLAEKRPSVLMGDRIFVQPKEVANGHWFEGFVHTVELDTVVLHFNGSFRKGWNKDKLYNVRFKLNRHMIRREQYALSCDFIEDRVLFPTATHLPVASYTDALTHPLITFNPNIANNSRQLQAVVSILNQIQGAPPFIVFGPPGTGKTVTIVEAIRQIIKKDPNAKILACAPSNSAADLIAQRLMDLGKDTLFRFYAPSREKIQVPEELFDYTCITPEGHFSAHSLEKMEKYRIVVSTCGSASFASGIGMSRGHFSHIFVDEAGQASEPEVMIPIKTLTAAGTNVVLSGDPKQLGPVIRSAVARQLGLEESYLERLMKNGPYDVRLHYGATVVKLIKNFRSHKAILQFPNERFYEGELEPWGDKRIINSFLQSSYLPTGNFPVVFHGVQGKDEREASSPSFFNVEEILLVKDYVKRLLADGSEYNITEEDIGVISPYHAQSRKIRKELKEVASGVKIGSVEEFQGQERRVIIISTVRSSIEFVEYDLKHTLGFVASPRRFNVAVTRAQALLIVIGDPTVLSLDPLWRSFLNYIHSNGGWTGSPITWDPNVPVDEAGGYDQQIRDAATAEMNDLTARIEELVLASVEADGNGNIDRPWRSDD